MASDRYRWLIFAVASGACAAINGTFAKLTTTSLTTSLSTSLASLLHVPASWSSVFEYGLRAFFFALNLTFDALMWGLFTRALTLASSTVHVSVLNTSTNFLIAALSGLFVFGERLPGLWWVGAAMLVGGCWVIGRREKGREVKGHGDEGDAEVDNVGLGGIKIGGEPDDPLPAPEQAGRASLARSRSPYHDDSGDEGRVSGERASRDLLR